jgi:hypothetical protein
MENDHRITNGEKITQIVESAYREFLWRYLHPNTYIPVEYGVINMPYSESYYKITTTDEKTRFDVTILQRFYNGKLVIDKNNSQNFSTFEEAKNHIATLSSPPTTLSTQDDEMRNLMNAKKWAEETFKDPELAAKLEELISKKADQT